MTISNSISRLIQAYNIQNLKVPVIKNNPFENRVPQDTNIDKELYRSPLNTPVITDITLKGDTYTDQAGKIRSFNDITLVTVLVTVSKPKRIVTTEIQGRDGTVKEYIGQDDKQVTISGILPGGNGHYPIDEVRALDELTDAPLSIEVVSVHLQNLGIYNLVIREISYDQEPGGYSQQKFTMDCISDTPIELQIV